MSYKDKNGTVIEKFDEVYVPEPNVGDIHNFEFNGFVESFRNGNAVVSDDDGNFFEIEPERIEKIYH